MMISHWTEVFGGSNCILPAVLIFVQFVASLILMRFNDWYVLCRTSQRESSVECLEALFALEDCRGISRLRPWLKR